MHFRAGVVEGRDAEKHIVPGLAVVVLLREAGAVQRPVAVQNRLGEAGGAGGEVDGGQVLLVQGDRGSAGGAEAHETDAVLGVGRAVLADEEHGVQLLHLALHLVHPLHKLRTEDQHLHVRQVKTISDFLGGVSEIHGHGDAAGLQNAKIYGKILQAVHHEDGHLGAPL